MFLTHSHIDIKLLPMAFKKKLQVYYERYDYVFTEGGVNQGSKRTATQPTASLNKVVSYKIHH